MYYYSSFLICWHSEIILNKECITNKINNYYYYSSSQTLLPVPMSSGETLSCGDNFSALPLLFVGSSLPVKDRSESTSKSSGPVLFTAPEASGCAGRRRKQTRPCLVMPNEVHSAEEGLKIRKVPLVVKLWYREDKSCPGLIYLSSTQSHGESHGRS